MDSKTPSIIDLNAELPVTPLPSEHVARDIDDPRKEQP